MDVVLYYVKTYFKHVPLSHYFRAVLDPGHSTGTNSTSGSTSNAHTGDNSSSSSYGNTGNSGGESSSGSTPPRLVPINEISVKIESTSFFDIKTHYYNILQACMESASVTHGSAHPPDGGGGSASSSAGKSAGGAKEGLLSYLVPSHSTMSTLHESVVLHVMKSHVVGKLYPLSSPHQLHLLPTSLRTL